MRRRDAQRGARGGTVAGEVDGIVVRIGDDRDRIIRARCSTAMRPPGGMSR